MYGVIDGQVGHKRVEQETLEGFPRREISESDPFDELLESERVDAERWC